MSHKFDWELLPDVLESRVVKHVLRNEDDVYLQDVLLIFKDVFTKATDIPSRKTLFRACKAVYNTSIWADIREMMIAKSTETGLFGLNAYSAFLKSQEFADLGNED